MGRADFVELYVIAARVLDERQLDLHRDWDRLTVVAISIGGLSMCKRWLRICLLLCIFACAGVLAGCASGGAISEEGARTDTAWQNEANWDRLRKGMSEADVRGLLRDPDSVVCGRYLTYWQYGKKREGAQVMFDARSKLVKVWEKPKVLDGDRGALQ